MSVALEVEYEAFYPRLKVVPDVPGRARPSARVQRRRVILGAVALGLLSCWCCRSGPGRPDGRGFRVPRRGRSTWSVAATRSPRLPSRWVGATWPRRATDWPARAGSSVLVPGEHLLIP